MSSNRPPEETTHLSSIQPFLFTLLKHTSQKLTHHFLALKSKALEKYSQNQQTLHQNQPIKPPQFFSTYQPKLNLTTTQPKNNFFLAMPDTSTVHKSTLMSSVTSPITTIVILFLLIIFITPSLTHKVSKVIFDHPLMQTSFHLYTETEDPDLIMFTNKEMNNPRFFRIFFPPPKNLNSPTMGDDTIKEFYVTGRDHFYRLKLANINENALKSANISDHPDFFKHLGMNMNGCRDMKQSQIHGDRVWYMCQNHVQSIYFVPQSSSSSSSSSELIICSSGLNAPQLYSINLQTLKVNYLPSAHKYPSESSGIGICPPMPYTLFTTILLNSTTPTTTDSTTPTTPPPITIFSGVNVNNMYDSLIVRSTLNASNLLLTHKVTSHKHNYLEDVGFVASIQTDKYVYVFTLEKGQFLSSSSREEGHFTMVNRICKNDMGRRHGKKKNKFSTHFKLKMLCRVRSNPYHFYFNRLTDIKYDQSKQIFHALFTTEDEKGSAICVYRQDVINNGFDKGYELRVITRKSVIEEDLIIVKHMCFDNIPNTDATKQCPNSSPAAEEDSMKEEDFIAEGGLEPFFMGFPIALNHSTSFQRLAVEKVNLTDCIGTTHPMVDYGCYVYWLYDASRPGFLQRAFLRLLYKKNELVSINTIRLFKHHTQISNLWDLQVQTVNKKAYVYAVTDRYVVQVNTAVCSTQYRCTTCVTDPHCMWDNKQRKCLHRDYSLTGNDLTGYSERYLIRRFTNSSFLICQKHCFDEQPQIQRTNGTSLHLYCPSMCHASSHPTWFLNNKPLFNLTTDVDDNTIKNSRNTFLNFFHLPDVASYDQLYYDKIAYSSDTVNNPYSKPYSSQQTPTHLPSAILDPLTFALIVPQVSHDLHNGTYECRDAVSGMVLARYHVRVFLFCKYGVDLEATWKGEYSKWCSLYEEQVNLQICSKKCLPATDCTKNCLKRL